MSNDHMPVHRAVHFVSKWFHGWIDDEMKVYGTFAWLFGLIIAYLVSYCFWGGPTPGNGNFIGAIVVSSVVFVLFFLPLTIAWIYQWEERYRSRADKRDYDQLKKEHEREKRIKEKEYALGLEERPMPQNFYGLRQGMFAGNYAHIAALESPGPN